MSETSPSEATGSKLESMEPTSDFAKDTNCELPTISVTSVSENSSSSSKSSTNKKAVTTDYTDQALHEMPKIKNGVQHLLTIALAKLHLQNQNGDKTLVMNKDIAKCIGMLLINKINTFTLPNIQEWVRMNPRTNERTKEERMEDLSKYGCIHSLQLLARSRKKNATEFFGKNYFVWTNVWANIRDSIFEDESENPTLDRNLLKFALTLFGKSLSAKGMYE